MRNPWASAAVCPGNIRPWPASQQEIQNSRVGLHDLLGECEELSPKPPSFSSSTTRRCGSGFIDSTSWTRRKCLHMPQYDHVESRPRVDLLKESWKELVMHGGGDVLAGWQLDVKMAAAPPHRRPAVACLGGPKRVSFRARSQIWREMTSGHRGFLPFLCGTFELFALALHLTVPAH